MARPLAPLLLVVAAAAAAGFGVASAASSPLLGGWSTLKDASDLHIQELGGWAVAQHVKLASDGLRFRRVTRGEQQVVSGTNYRLIVDAADGSGRSTPYVAVVYEQSWTNTRKLTSFKPAAN